MIRGIVQQIVPVVEDIYDLKLKKLQQKVSQLFTVDSGVHNNILKVYPSPTSLKALFSKWPPSSSSNDHCLIVSRKKFFFHKNRKIP